jgi:hypothetical protein
MESYSFGRALSRAFTLVREGLPTVGLFMLAIQIVSSAMNFLLQGQLAGQFRTNLDAGSTAANPTAIFSMPLYWLAVVLGLVLAVVLYTGSIYGYLKVEQGKPVSIGECFSAGLAKFLPGLGLLILWGLGVSLGWVLLVVPGIMLMTAWSTALPALVGEGIGVTESFGRSRYLTKGYRWAIFGTLLVALLLIYVPAFVFGGAAIASSGTALMTGQAPSLIFVVSTAVYGWLVAMFLNALLVSIYVDCRVAKEGGASGELSEVFG